jgi:hypothetical protein
VHLTNLPPGNYAVRVWHPRLAVNESATSRPVRVTGANVTEVAWNVKLKRDSRIHRAPTRSGSGYR